MLQRHQDTTQPEQNGQLYVQTTSLQEDQYDYKDTIEILASTIRGELILPDNPAYEAGRKVWNGSFDRYPAAIVRCADAEDVKVAVNVAREYGMTLSVRSGAHSLAWIIHE